MFVREDIIDLLKNVHDIERLASKMSNTNTNASAATATTTTETTNTNTVVPPSEPTNVQSSVTNSDQLDTNTQLPTGKSKVIENENGLLIQVFE